MKSYEAMVDKSMAEEILKKNKFYDRDASGRTNRPVSKLQVAAFAAAMLRGEWILTHQGVAIDADGTLVDGQHRLLAVLQAAQTNEDIQVPLTITEDVDPEVFDVIDTGRARSGKDVLALKGEKDTMHLNSALRHLYLYRNVEHYLWSRTRVTNPQILETLEENPSIRDELALAKALQAIGMIATAGAVGLYVCRDAYSDRMEEYVDGLRHGVALELGDPRLALRNTLIRQKNLNNSAAGGRRSATKVHLAMFIKGWNDFVNGRKREMIAWRFNEEYPTPKPPVAAVQ